MDQDDIDHIENMISLHKKNLYRLEEMLATYGTERPLHLINSVEKEREKLAGYTKQREHITSASGDSENHSFPLHNLPPRDYGIFIGRKKELEDIICRLLPNDKGGRFHLITIDGIGGIGKTSLASEAAYYYKDNYSALPEDEKFEAVVWVSAKRTYLTAHGISEKTQPFRTLPDLYAAIASVFHYPAITRAREEKQRAIVVRELRQRRTLLIVDNLETIEDEKVMDFLMDLPNPSKAIITTRRRRDVAYPVRLKGLPDKEAIRLISQECERKNVCLSAKDRDELMRRTGGVPLAIVWSIGLIGLELPPSGVFRRLGEGQNDITKFCFEESVSQIKDENVRKILLTFSLFYIDANVAAIKYISGFERDIDTIEEGLSQLIQLSLINKDKDRYSLLPLTREFVKNEARKDPAWLKEAQERSQNYFYELAERLGDYSKDGGGQEHVDREMSNILMVTEGMIDRLKIEKSNDGNRPFSEASTASAKKLLDFLRVVIRTCRVRGYWSDCEALCMKSIQISRDINDADGIGWRYYDLCRINYLRGDLKSAKHWAQECKKEWQRVRLPTSQALRLLGLIALAQNQIAQAEKLITAALSEYKGLGKDGTLSLFLESRGKLAEKMGDYQDALNWYRKATEISRQKKDSVHLTTSLLSLGNLYVLMENYGQARRCLKESVRLAEKCGRVDNIADAAFGLGLLHFKTNNRTEAKKCLQRAAELYRRLNIKGKQTQASTKLTQIK